jgi:hypothetical protein
MMAMSVSFGVFAEERPDVGEKLLVPSSARTGAFKSLLVVLNQGTQDNVIKIKARGTTGSSLGSEFSTTLAPGGRYRNEDILAALNVPLASGSFGPITIESTNGQQLSAISEVSSVTNGLPGPGGAFPGVNVNTAWEQGFIADVVDTGSKGGAPGTYRTNLGVNTVSGGAASVTVTLHSDSGSQVGNPLVIGVPGNGLNQQNLVVRLLVGSSGVTGQTGYLKLVSNVPIVAWATKIENGSEDPSFQLGIAATSISQFAPAGVQTQNNVLFVFLALLAPLVFFLWQWKNGSESDLNDGRIATVNS